MSESTYPEVNRRGVLGAVIRILDHLPATLGDGNMRRLYSAAMQAFSASPIYVDMKAENDTEVFVLKSMFGHWVDGGGVQAQNNNFKQPPLDHVPTKIEPFNDAGGCGVAIDGVRYSPHAVEAFVINLIKGKAKMHEDILAKAAK